MKYTVWWFEVDSFDGKERRCYRDFEKASMARQFEKHKAITTGSKTHFSPIKNCPWHHLKAYAKIY